MSTYIYVLQSLQPQVDRLMILVPCWCCPTYVSLLSLPMARVRFGQGEARKSSRRPGNLISGAVSIDDLTLASDVDARRWSTHPDVRLWSPSAHFASSTSKTSCRFFFYGGDCYYMPWSIWTVRNDTIILRQLQPSIHQHWHCKTVFRKELFYFLKLCLERSKVLNLSLVNGYTLIYVQFCLSTVSPSFFLKLLFLLLCIIIYNTREG